MITENVSTLKIHKLTKAQYERELAAGRIDENALYLTPDEEIDYTIFATVDQLDGKADSEHTHSVEDVEDFQQKIDETLAASKSYTDGLISGKADENHNHDDKYYTEGEIDSKLSTINSSITDITSGTIAVKEAEHSETATKATQDASGNVIVDTYETKTDAVSKLDEAKSYTDTAIANLVNSAPETMDTLGELATAMKENQDVVDALNQAIANKSSDWNQNDETADDFIKNRTHYECIEENILIDNLNSEDYYNALDATSPIQCRLISGNTYKVIWNGEVYDNIVCFSSGDTKIIGDEREYPFFIMGYDLAHIGLYDCLEIADVYSPPSAAKFTISIIEKTEAIKKLDEKFIPDEIARVNQGIENADKILTTDSEGKVVAELTAWTMSNVIETLADTDLINILKVHDDSVLADTDGNVLSF